ncbi:hypothetical protein [Campylobacter troglodytis]|uniref:hypothetical protein n=1 Tax=Campylobacter troglodytis TaxID=654363 RepID=UPI00163C6BEE|nr:hypothetical protein [Campylobacter troglodytis]
MDFCLVLLATLQEGAKAHYRVKHSKNEFAKGHKQINEIANFFTSHSCSCVVEEALRS